MVKICVFLADGFEEIEGLSVVDICRRAGIDVTTASINGTLQVQGAHAIPVGADALFEEVDFASMDGIVLPGGMPGTKYLQEHEGVNAQAKQFAADGRLTAAICAAPSVFGNAGILDGIPATCYPGFETPGATWTGESVVVCGNIITGKGPGVAALFALALVTYLVGEEKAAELKASMQMP